MPARVTVTTGARLHFGLLAHAPQARRQFGGIGLMIDQPGFQISVSAAGDGSSGGWDFQGPDAWRDRAQTTLQHCCQQLHLPQANWRVELQRELPAHCGLGSGTQLALAMARAMLEWQAETGCRDKTISAVELGRLAQRGKRSALGIHGFETGGFMVEVGKSTSDQISPAAVRLDWPMEWQIVLIRPPRQQGLSGRAEVAAFAEMPPMSEVLSARLCKIALLDVVPAIMEQDFDVVAESLYEFGRLNGDYFAPYQGGTYASPEIGEMVPFVRQAGFRGVGQTSWGPTAFVVCPSPAAASDLVHRLQSARWGDCQIWTAQAMNRGAAVHIDT